ncbi:hypothetical protein CONPUDRAFT_163294 [Coniophora puteana RWD-64-598 SS2]|uniref:Metal homeostatis protein bsd2 n=1 Tax=Coniophora puteana (strain RWD-64-598) TaxID=741705 RepID=A0A5M3MY82_CONPW|nr:uncharacterized protein CONPUDRAFT_163294 [Coniophora puteana RWD-64-598 SS2]EIW84059.1 hypothetical protein CONPUDRAFT_163294 [Coniophora puteana RWD-64-598 SS2]
MARSTAHYAALPTRQPAADTDRELEDAFGPEEDEDEDLSDAEENTPLALYANRDHHRPSPSLSQPHSTNSTSTITTPSAHARTASVPGTYDFERDYEYDRPPPGSPPRPSAHAIPNDWGNSNGILPTSPVAPLPPRQGFFRRAVGAVGAVLPTHYARVPTNEPGADPGGPMIALAGVHGGGAENDGVFANVSAKPTRPSTVRVVGEDGNIHMVPEETQSTAPPSYAAAQADAAPPYWETTVHAPAGLDGDGGLVIEDLPSGTLFAFGANLFTSFFFQFVGFILTYLLHTSHAAKYGSRAGLGLTLIQYGFYSRGNNGYAGGEDGVAYNDETSLLGGRRGRGGPTPTADIPSPGSEPLGGLTSREWASFLLMTLGWFLLLSSLIGFWRIKHWERALRQAHARGPPTSEEVAHDAQIRRNLAEVFGLNSGSPEDEVDGEPVPPTAHRRSGSRRSGRRSRSGGGSGAVGVAAAEGAGGAGDTGGSPGVMRHLTTREAAEAADARLAEDLRAAGLL